MVEIAILEVDRPVVRRSGRKFAQLIDYWRLANHHRRSAVGQQTISRPVTTQYPANDFPTNPHNV
jgi:hypothetical protein